MTAPTNAVLATLTIRTPNVDIKGKKKTTFAKGASGQVLREGDTLRTDATQGLAEISYTDGSSPRLGPTPSTRSPSSPSRRVSARRKGHSPSVPPGTTRPRSPRLAGSFEVKAGGATAAVEGTLFSVVCTVPTSCQFIDLFDPVLVTMGGTQVQLESAKTVTSEQGQLTSVQNLTREELLANLWVAGNVFLDNVLAFAEPIDLPPMSAPPADQPPPPPPVAAATPSRPTRSSPRRSTRPMETSSSTSRTSRWATRSPSAVRVRSRRDAERPVRRWAGRHVPSDGGGNFAGSITIPRGDEPGPAPAHGARLRVRAQHGDHRGGCAGDAFARVHRLVESHPHLRARRIRGGDVRRRARARTRRRRASTSPGSGPPSV